MMVTNYDHLRSLCFTEMAAVIWNLCEDYCAFCPRNMKRNCNNNCAAGLREWLRSPYIPSSSVWKERK